MGFVWKFLNDTKCPLEGDELAQAKRNWTWLIARKSFRDFRAGRVGVPMLRLKSCGLSLSDWVRYFRRPARSRLAGAPLNDAGDYIVPSWCRLESKKSESISET
jgi:hypothetical protein